MKDYIEAYVDWLVNRKKSSKNTVEAYKRDLLQFIIYMESLNINRIEDIKSSHINSYINYLESNNKSPASISRQISSLKTFFNFLIKKKIIDTNPFFDVKPIKFKKKIPTILTVEEVERLLEQPDLSSLNGIRDKAILELLYATGLKVSELVNLDVQDIDFEIGFVKCCSDYKERVIPLGKMALRALENYVKNARSKFVDGVTDQKALFVNFKGERITRQACWKIIKKYAKKASINKTITPNTLRHSFALHLIENGADLKSVQDMLGNVDMSSIQKYVVLTKNKIKEVYNRTHPRA